MTGSIKPTPNHDAKKDAEVLRGAMKGLGTNEKEIISVIGCRTDAELVQVALEFKTLFGRDLPSDIKSETSGNFEDALVGRLMLVQEFEARSLNKAISGAGTDEACLIHVLVNKSNAQVKTLKDEYRRLFKKELEKDIEGDTSGDFKRFMISLVQGNRDESTAPNQEAAHKDAEALYKAGEGKIGTDESKFNQILASRSYPQIRLISEEYAKLSKKDLAHAIDSEMSGWLKEAMMAVVRCAVNSADYYAELFYKSMKGAGTDDRTLIRLVLTRCQVDMEEIKAAFQKKYGKSLAKFIDEDTSGDYKKLLIQLVGH